MAYMYNMWLSSSIYIQVRPLRKEKFQRSYSRSTASSSAWICVVIWWYSLVCSTLCSKSSSSKTHTLNNTFSHWIFFVVCVACIAFVLCTHQNSVSNTSSSSASFQKVVNLISPVWPTAWTAKKYSTARRIFLKFYNSRNLHTWFWRKWKFLIISKMKWILQICVNNFI